MARDRSLDVARGALMLYIVAVIHGVWWLNVFGGQRIGGMLLFEMPAIFAVSGYAYRLFEASGSGGRAFRGVGDYLGFCVTRLSRILVPYFGYALVAVLLVLLLKGRLGHGDWSPWEVAKAWADPLACGGRFSVGSMNWHLWFIGPFLAVSALLPVATRLVPKRGMPLWAFTAVLTGVMVGFVRLPVPNMYFSQTVLFYLAWALFGYGLAMRRDDGIRDQVITFLGTVIVLLVVAARQGWQLNLQGAKFPPVWTFAVFSGAWMAVLLGLIRSVPKDVVQRLAEARWFRPWIASGYSIYLWQGAGYSLARLAEDRWRVPTVLTWLLAVALSLAFGLAAAPLERLRFRRTPSR